MDTLICSACGCSLVTLGIGIENAVHHDHDGQHHHFCCQGCLDLFIAEPQKYLRLTDGVTVCPNCLGEKPPDLVQASVVCPTGSDLRTRSPNSLAIS